MNDSGERDEQDASHRASRMNQVPGGFRFALEHDPVKEQAASNTDRKNEGTMQCQMNC